MKYFIQIYTHKRAHTHTHKYDVCIYTLRMYIYKTSFFFQANFIISFIQIYLHLVDV